MAPHNQLLGPERLYSPSILMSKMPGKLGQINLAIYPIMVSFTSGSLYIHVECPSPLCLTNFESSFKIQLRSYFIQYFLSLDYGVDPIQWCKWAALPHRA